MQLEVAETVYNDMLACAWRNELASLPSPTMARRGGLSNRAQLPDAEALAALVQVGGMGMVDDLWGDSGGQNPIPLAACMAQPASQPASQPLSLC